MIIIRQNIRNIDKKISEKLKLVGKDPDNAEQDDILLDDIAKLIDMREQLNTSKRNTIFGDIGGDTIFNGAVSIAGILLILRYEHEDIITSKAFNVASRWLGK